MSIAVAKQKAASVVTMATEAKRMLPPLCQILKALCCSPECCSVNGRLMPSSVIGAFGAVQIMVGLFNIGLGPGRTSMHPEDFTDLKAAYWLGAVYIAAGSVSVFADRFPSRCLVGFAVFMNIAGSIFAVVGVVLYAIDLGEPPLSTWCDQNLYDENCRMLAHYAQRLMIGMDVTLIILSCLQLCVCIGFSVLGINALLGRGKDVADGENYQPVLKEVTSPGA
ncbi:uncharacterized protein LOC103362362 [Stegastes partitus]|uniref:Uncharacterized LOC103362362 n=1 Tax=Stegastes partitus TaxID=144197 RepID=A0A3B5AE52_9TELE|nr:PREDICTED: uncharacterized protein LOC103362362 [Stegastes partitus]